MVYTEMFKMAFGDGPSQQVYRLSMVTAFSVTNKATPLVAWFDVTKMLDVSRLLASITPHVSNQQVLC